MKRKTLLMLGLVVVLGTANTAGALAAGTDDKNAASTAAVGFDNDGTDEEGKVTPPVDPEYPDEDIEPGDGGQTGNTGNLRIDYVSSFNFGSANRISGGDQEIYAGTVEAVKNGQQIKVPNYAQVSDLRGTGEGWTLYVEQDCQFTYEDEEYTGYGAELTGASIKLSNIKTSTINVSGPVKGRSDVILAPGEGKQAVMQAETDSGYGTHVAHFGYTRADHSGERSIALNIPRSAAVLEGSYNTTFTWTLSDAPTEDFQ